MRHCMFHYIMLGLGRMPTLDTSPYFHSIFKNSKIFFLEEKHFEEMLFTDTGNFYLRILWTWKSYILIQRHKMTQRMSFKYWTGPFMSHSITARFECL